MRALKTITQIFGQCAEARVKASLVLCIAAFIFSPLTVHAETAALQYDNNGNITQRSVTNGATTQTTTYTYDPLNRLTGESGPAKTQTITYDENGNRLSDGAGSYVYETTSNRMSTRLSLAVTFDAAGNMTADGTGRTFTYNEMNQLYQVLQGGVLLATYEYDAIGLRMSKTTTASAPQGEQTVVYIYDQWGKIIAEVSGTGAPIRAYIWRNNAPVAQIEDIPSRKILYFETDHLNTPRAAMDETGKVVWRWESDAFGSTTPNEDVDGDGNKTTVNLRRLGEYADVESGLVYNTFRYLDPGKGRYIQPDPIGLAGGMNPYTHVENNPLMFVDPLGLFTSDVHLDLSANAVKGQGLPGNLAADAIMWSVWADFLPGSQGTSNADWHAMKRPRESDAVAYQRYYDFVMQQLKRCDAQGLGRALHAVEDSVAGGHGFKEYHGSVGLGHIFEDKYPSAQQRKEAIMKGRIIIDLFKQQCACSK